MVDEHECQAGVACEHTVNDLNPAAQASKATEMAVRRILGLIEAWEALPPGGDWADVPMATYRRVLGNDHYQQRTVLLEAWRRFKSGILYSQVEEAAANLPPSVLKKEELRGLRDIRSKSSGGGTKRTPRPAPGKRQRTRVRRSRVE